MSNIERHLMTGEQVVYRGHLHWVVFRWPAIFLAAFVAAVIYLPTEYMLRDIGWIFAAAAVATGISSAVTWMSSDFIITNKRLIAKVGFVHSHSVELLLAKVEAITVDQEIIGRILDYGTIGVTGTGGTRETFNTIAAPFEFRRWAQEQIAAVQEPNAPGAWPGARS